MPNDEEPSGIDPNQLKAEDLFQVDETFDALLACYDRARKMVSSDTRIFTELKEVGKRYQHSQPLSIGGMKRILKTRDARTGRPIAMAVLKRVGDLYEVENFLREARITAHLEHPNIVPIYDIGLRNGEPYFTMKLLTGENLGRILNEIDAGNEDYLREYPLNVLLEIFLKVCDAVSFAHSEGVIHLDLKPENIQISDFGEVLVCDWGLAVINEEVIEREDDILDDQVLVDSFVQSTTIHGTIKGTPGYMAPEQLPVRSRIRGRKNRPRDERTDIYSLGSILYTMLTGCLPIDAEEPNEIMSKTRVGQIVPPNLRRPDLNIPASIEAVAVKAMALLPKDRYTSVEEMKPEIGAFINGFATEAQEAGFFIQLRMLGQRNKWVVGLISSMVICLAGVVMWYTRAVRIQESNARDAQRRAEISSREAESNLKMYRAEQARLARMADTPALYYEALEFWQGGEVDRAYAVVNKALDWNKNLFLAWELKGHIHFARHEFRQAVAAYVNSRDPQAAAWKEKASRFSRYPRNNQGLLDSPTILHVMREMGAMKTERPVKYFVDRALASNMREKERIRLMNGGLRFDNPGDGNWVPKMVKGERGLEVDLSGKPNLVNLRFVQHLPIVVLDLSGSRVEDLRALNSCPIEQLNLAGAMAARYEALAIPELKVLDLRGLPLDRQTLQNFLEKTSIERIILTDPAVLDATWLAGLERKLEVEEGGNP